MSPVTNDTPVMPMSQFRWVGDLLVTSGLAAIDGEGVLNEPFSAQLAHIFGQFDEILSSQDLTPDDVVSVNVFLASMDDFTRLNEAFLRFFAAPFPVRTTIACTLFPGLLVEMSMTASKANATF